MSHPLVVNVRTAKRGTYVYVGRPAFRGKLKHAGSPFANPFKEGMDPMVAMRVFTDAIGEDDAEHMRQTLFASGNLAQPYHSINTDVNKRIRYLDHKDQVQ